MTTSTKPVVKGPLDGNIFSVAAACSTALKRAGMRDKVEEMQTKIMNAESYDKALCVCMDYVVFDLGGDDNVDESDWDNGWDDSIKPGKIFG
jgi:hypothetical protein